MRFSSVFFLAFFAFLLQFTLPAQVSDQTPKGFRYVDVTPAPRFWGGDADFEFGFRALEGVDTAIWTRISAAYGGGFGGPQYFRTPNGSLYYAPTYPLIDTTRTLYDNWNLQWGAGIEQGLHFNTVKDRNDLTLLLAYRGWWDNNLLSTQTSSLLAQSSIPDNGGDMTHSFVADLLYDGTVTGKGSKMLNGSWFDTSVEYSPLGFSTPKETGYVQFSASGKQFLPLYEKLTADGWNLFSLYFAGYLVVDYIKGLGSDPTQGIPAHVSQSIGGKFYLYGLGGQIRGLAPGYLDGTLKAVSNIELRANLPALFVKDFVPGLLAYFDAGYFADPPGLSQSAPLSHGFVSGAGLGLYVDVLDLAYLALYTNFLFTQNNFDGAWWNPVTLEFGLHF